MKHLKQDALTQESINERNIALLRENFPGVIEENIDGSFTVNANKLQMLIDPKNATIEENGYELNWVGKKEAYHTAFSKNTKILKPLKEDSKDFDNTGNILIKGDNLDALKILKNNYFEAIKMIYIDPPYNTKSENFVYRDNFTKSLEETMEELGYDAENIDYIKNIQGARTHSGWLSFMYPRLLLARDLLKDDGVIFISIDDNEQANLKILCDEIFGENNFIAQLAIQVNPRGRHLDKFVAKTHETILVYVKNSNSKLSIYGADKTGGMLEEYDREDSKGAYRLLGLRNRNQSFNPETRPNLYYPLFVNQKTGEVSIEKDAIYTDEALPDTSDGIQTCWTWGKEKVVKDGELLIAEKVNNEWRIFRKDYFLDEDGNVATTLIKSLLIDKDVNNDYGRKAVKELFGQPIMDFPKSPELISKLIEVGSKDDDIVLDFFAGSGTTGQSVFQSNVKDDKKRKFILIQWAEKIDSKKEAYTYITKTLKKEATIFEITAERLRRAGEKIKADNEGAENLDVGFRIFEIVEDEKQAIYKKSLEEITQADLGLLSVPQLEDIDTVLYNLLVAEALPLSTKIKCLKENAFYIADNVAFIVGEIELEEVSKLIKQHKEIEYITIYSPLVNENKFSLEVDSELSRLGFSNDKLRFRG